MDQPANPKSRKPRGSKGGPPPENPDDSGITRKEDPENAKKSLAMIALWQAVIVALITGASGFATAWLTKQGEKASDLRTKLNKWVVFDDVHFDKSEFMEISRIYCRIKLDNVEYTCPERIELPAVGEAVSLKDYRLPIFPCPLPDAQGVHTISVELTIIKVSRSSPVRINARTAREEPGTEHEIIKDKLEFMEGEFIKTFHLRSNNREVADVDCRILTVTD